MGCASLWHGDGVAICGPATISLTARPTETSMPPRAQVCAAVTADGMPGVHLAVFNLPTKQWSEGVATIREALALATAILAQALIAEERWGRQ